MVKIVLRPELNDNDDSYWHIIASEPVELVMLSEYKGTGEAIDVVINDSNYILKEHFVTKKTDSNAGVIINQIVVKKLVEHIQGLHDEINTKKTQKESLERIMLTRKKALDSAKADLKKLKKGINYAE